MKLDGRRESSNVEDRRGLSGKAIAGGGIGAVIIAALFAWMSGGDPLSAGLQAAQEQMSQRTESVNPEEFTEEEQALLFVKIKNLQQADFSIEEIKTLLPGDDDLLMAAFEQKIKEQQQKLERIREIQRSYLKETMDMQKLVSAMTPMTGKYAHQ